jgi:hypothetical protein
MLSVLPFVAFGIALVGTTFGINYWLEKKRAEAFEKFAALNGFSVGTPLGFSDWTSLFKLFSLGRNGRQSHVMHGQRAELRVVLGDFTYITGTGKNAKSNHRTFCMAQKTNVKKAGCLVRPQNAVFDRLGKMLGGQDINFEDDPEFSKYFVLQTEDDEQLVRRQFGALIRNQLTALRLKNPHFEAQGDLIVFHRGSRLKEAELTELLSDTVNTARAWWS